MDNIIVRFIALPPTIHGVTEMDSEGDYNVYLNANISTEDARKAFEHEMRHIKMNHFYRDISAAEAEREARL